MELVKFKIKVYSTKFWKSASRLFNHTVVWTLNTSISQYAYSSKSLLIRKGNIFNKVD